MLSKFLISRFSSASIYRIFTGKVCNNALPKVTITTGILSSSSLLSRCSKLGVRNFSTFANNSSNGGTLKYLSLFAVGVQWVVFLHASGIVFKNEPTEKYYDLTGSLTFLGTLGLSLYFAKNLTARQITLSSFVAMWSMRLGYFLFTRINNNGIDSRFTEMKKELSKFFTAWTVQGLWVFVTLLPVTILNQCRQQAPIGKFDYIGMSLWVLGFLFEVLADYQKSEFRSKPENKDKFINEGLWSISRHPNYFGEILLWTGMAISSYGGSKHPAVFLSPLFVSFLLVFISGIPLLEKKADERYGGYENYQNYKKKTPVLIPYFGRSGDSKF